MQPVIRPPVCADDRWYPSDSRELRSILGQYLDLVHDEPIDGQLIGLIAPHAGLAFAGSTAAHAYKQLDGRSYDRVVLLGPSHFADLGAQATNSAAGYETPLGEIPVDKAAIEKLGRRIDIRFVRSDREHSLEMQLPFLQYQLENFNLVPLMLSYPFYLVGQAARRPCQELAAGLDTIADDRTLFVASSDLSHLDDDAAVQRNDARTEQLLTEFGLDPLIEYMSGEGICRACGDMAIVTLLMAARSRGANRVRVLSRTNSSEVLGRHVPGQYTVGYLSAAVYRSPN